MKPSLHSALPSIDSLLIFEQAAHYLSFTRAAQQVGLTQSAVSRQIIDLEQLLRTPLFTRERQRLKLTAAGTEFREQIRGVIQELQRATMRMQLRGAQSNVLNVSVAASFCNLWFIPHLPAYYQEEKAAQVNVTPHVGRVGFERTGFDAAILNAEKPPENLEFVKLCDITVAPYGAKDLLATLDSRQLAGLATLPALMLRESDDAWPRFLAAAGLSHLEINYVGMNSLILLNYEAVRAGLGIGLLPPEFVDRDVMKGELVRMHDATLPIGRAYYFAWPVGHEKEAALRHLGTWIQRRCAAALASTGSVTPVGRVGPA